MNLITKILMASMVCVAASFCACEQGDDSTGSSTQDERPGQDSESDTGSQGDPDAGGESDESSDAGAGSDPGGGSDTGVGSDPGGTSDTGVGSDPGRGSDTGVGSESDDESDPEVDSEPRVDVTFGSYSGAVGTQIFGTDETVEFLNGVTVGKDGGVYAVGLTDGALDPDGSSGGGRDIAVVRYSSAGGSLTESWITQIGSPGFAFEMGRAIAAHPSGGVVITGMTYSDLGTEPLAGAMPAMGDGFVAKLDATGDLEWTVVFGSQQEDFSAAICTDPAGNIYVTGKTLGRFAPYENAGDADVFVARFSSKGELDWTYQQGTAEYEEGHGIAADAKGGVYVAAKGLVLGHGQITLGASLLKLDGASGKLLWSRETNSVGDDAWYDVVVDAQGAVYAIGTCDDHNCAAKFNPAKGVAVWTTHFDFEVYTHPRGLAFNSDALFASGVINPYAMLLGEDEDGDAFVTKIDKTGDVIWSYVKSTPYEEWSYGVAASETHVYAAGTNTGGSQGPNPGDREDGFVLVLDAD